MDAQSLFERIDNLLDWQKDVILVGLLSGLVWEAEKGDVKSVKGIESIVAEIGRYEKMNRRLDEEYGSSNG